MKIISLSCFMLLISWQSMGQTPVPTREAFNEKIEAVRKQLANATIESLSELDSHIEIARSQGWEEEEISIASFKAATLTRFEQFTEVQKLTDTYITRAKNLSNKSAYAKFVGSLLAISDSREDQVKSIEHRKELLRLSESGSLNNKALTYLKVAQSQSSFNEYKDALENLETALNIFEQVKDTNDSQGISITLSTIGLIYGELGQYEKSIEYYKKALTIAEERGDDFNRSVFLYNIGERYYNHDKYEQAQDYLNQALTLSEKLNDEIGIAYVKQILALISIENEQFDEAYTQLGLAIKWFDKHNLLTMLFGSKVSMLELMVKSNRLDEANNLLQDLEPHASQLEESGDLSAYYSLSYEIKKGLGDYESALFALEKLLELQKQQFTSEKEQSIEELMIKFDTGRKEAENKLLIQANELKALKLKEQEKHKTIWILSFSFAITIGAVIAVVLLKQIKTRNRFKQLALKDDLTRAPNRRAVLKQAKEHFKNFQQQNYSLTLAMLDIDNFKQFNDTYGHNIGDEVLKLMSHACNATLRTRDHYGRYGGEEWLLVMVDANVRDIESVFARLSEYLRKSTVNGVPDDVSITFSIGAAQATPADKDLYSVIKRADEKLYHAKQQGRNRFVI